jgi:hypothetical protein
MAKKNPGAPSYPKSSSKVVKRAHKGGGRTSLNQEGSRKSATALNGRKPSMGPR